MALGFAPAIGAALRPIAHLLVTPVAMPRVPTLAVPPSVASLPPANLLTPDLGEKWRYLSTGDVTTIQLQLVFPEPVTVNTLALLGTNAEADTTIRWLGTDDPAFFPNPDGSSYESAVTGESLPHWPQPDLGDWDETLHLTWLEVAHTHPYWMAEITFAHDYYQAGGIVVGYGYQPTIDVQDGAGILWDDPSPTRQTVGSKTYFDKRPKTRRYACALKIPTEQEAYGDVFRLERLLGGTEPVLVSLDPHPENPFLHDQTFVARMSDLAPLTNGHVTIFDKQLTFRELR